MKHGITPEHWENYVAGTLALDERDALEAHLIGCLSCWEFYERLAHVTARLQADGTLMSHRYPLSDGALQAGLRATYARICAGQNGQATPNSVQQRLQELEAVMTVFCGAQTAVNALQTAAAHSPAHSLKQVTRENWEPFLQRLSTIAQVLCGRTGARWLLESGRL
jgi:hypothetical protein